MAREDTPVCPSVIIALSIMRALCGGLPRFKSDTFTIVLLILCIIILIDKKYIIKSTHLSTLLHNKLAVIVLKTEKLKSNQRHIYKIMKQQRHGKAATRSSSISAIDIDVSKFKGNLKSSIRNGAKTPRDDIK